MKKVFLLACTCFVSLCSEEGMWPFHQIPKEKIAQKYGVELSDKWLEHAQKASLRISAGGSGSFISSKGLVMTNHHVGATSIHNLSSENANYFEEGFYAKTQEQELPCPNLYIDQLVSVSDITDDIMGKIGAELSFAEKEKVKKEAMADVQKRAEEKTGLQPQVVTLYHGAKYYLYLYKRYSDVRLVMAPERSAAGLGGDIDNFEYPRYSLDMCFFRVYEGGKPLQTDNYFKWSASGPKEGELLFVSGHPGKTKRMLTADHLKFSESVEIPLVLQYLEERLKMLEDFALRGQEQKRISIQQHHSLSNAHKVYKGLEKGFKESSPVSRKEEKDSLLYKDKESSAYAPWAKLKVSFEEVKSYMEEFFVLESIGSNYSKLYDVARNLVRLSEEKKLPNEKRLIEYVDTEVPRIALKVLSKEPFYPDLEVACLEDSLHRLSRSLGDTHPLIKKVLNGKSPKEIAEQMMSRTSLYDRDTRENLYHNLDKVESSQDPLILFVKDVDVYARAVRKQKEDTLDALQAECYAAIAEQEFNRYGDSVYPDATFTLRLSLGQMKGYEDLKPTTTLGGMFEHVKKHGFKEPYALLKQWEIAEKDLNKNASLNFVSTHDIIGGNSGSPVFNANAEWVGLIFDGNAYSITWSHLFDDTTGRAISVHSQGIVETLQNVYHAESLVKEIKGI
jgi:hypothetical protein